MARYGYMLLDQADADVNRQAMQLDTIGGYDRIFVDRRAKKPDEAGRVQRGRLIDILTAEDILYVASADRFCDNLRDFIGTAQAVTAAGASLVILQEGLDTRSGTGRAMIRLMEAVAKTESSYQSERKKAGIKAARQKGRRIGRPPVSIPPRFREICKDWSSGRVSGPEAARLSGLRSTSFYKKAGELGFKAPDRRPVKEKLT